MVMLNLDGVEQQLKNDELARNIKYSRATLRMEFTQSLDYFWSWSRLTPSVDIFPTSFV